MRKFFRTLSRAVSAIAVIITAASALGSCTSVDDTLGQNFIPQDQEMRLRIAETISAPKTYIAQNDTVLSSNQGMLFVGTMTDQTFGRMKASAMTDFFPYVIAKYTLSQADAEETDDETDEEEETVYFGYNPVADSAYIELLVTSVYGMPKKGQVFNIYEMRDSLKRDSIYFFTTPIRNKANTNEPLFTFEIGEDVPVNSQIRRKLTPTAQGVDFMKRLAEAGDDLYSEPQYNFHKQFYGLFMEPAPEYPDDGAVYQFELRSQDSESLFYSSFILWAHNHDRANPTQVMDTVVAYYHFSDTYYPIKNMNVNHTEFTYSGEIAERLNDTLQTSTPLQLTYAQGLGGVATILRFSDEMLDEINKLKEVAENDTYSTLVINNATLYFPLEDPSLQNRDDAANRLGMFYTYGQPKPENSSTYYPFFFTVPYYYVTPEYGPKPILDYNYAGENVTSTLGGSPTKSPYDGYLYRTQGHYRMNITYHLTLLLNYPDTTPRDLWLGPDVNTRHREYSQVVLKGSENPDPENRIKLVLTYTLIR